jgi:carbonic anhydrase/acetyltransferase-like protein (isoleucine patch superfamily)
MNRLTIDGEAWIAPTAVIIGDVEIKAYSNIGPNTVLRGEHTRIIIGSLSNIQEDCFIETQESLGVTIGSQVSIGYNSVLTGCTIRDGVVIGNGAVILPGAEIGEDSVIKHGTIIPQNMQIPPRSLVEGLPARIVKQLSDEELLRKQKYWQHVEKSLDFIINSSCETENQSSYGNVAV